MAIDNVRLRATELWRTLAAEDCIMVRTPVIVDMAGAHMEPTLDRMMPSVVGHCSDVMTEVISETVAEITPRPLAHVKVLSAPAWGLGAREWDR